MGKNNDHKHSVVPTVDKPIKNESKKEYLSRLSKNPTNVLPKAKKIKVVTKKQIRIANIYLTLKNPYLTIQ